MRSLTRHPGSCGKAFAGRVSNSEIGVYAETKNGVVESGDVRRCVVWVRVQPSWRIRNADNQARCQGTGREMKGFRVFETNNSPDYTYEVGGSSSSPPKAVVCTGNEFQNWFYVTRVADGKQFGDFGEKLPLDVCQRAVRASSSEVVCTGNEFMNWFYLTRISDGKKFGDRLSLETCLQLSQ